MQDKMPVTINFTRQDGITEQISTEVEINPVDHLEFSAGYDTGSVFVLNIRFTKSGDSIITQINARFTAEEGGDFIDRRN